VKKLDDILAYKRQEVQKKIDELDLKKLKERITPRFDQRSFQKALRRSDRTALIAEIKKASPSAGLIREDFRPTLLARSYELGGADALSVLTDVRFFQGELKYLLQARSATNLSCLRKDFIIHEYQIWEARLAEADAILLIVAALKRDELVQFMNIAHEAQLDVLVEVHDEAELDVALDIGAPVIGINNRNLQTFKTDLATTEKLASKVPKEVTLVSESGIYTPEDVKRMKACGAHAILVGESLMRQPDVESAARTLMAV
jgi:indole-3-glycerol phosphate synthase